MTGGPDITRPESALAAEVGKRGPFDTTEQEVLLNLIRTHERLIEHFDRLFREHGLSQPQYNVLRILRGNRQAPGAPEAQGGAMPIQRIAEQMLTREPDMTRLIDRLERAGLVTRSRCPNDGRVVRTAITDKALDLLALLDEPVLCLHHDLLAHMTPDRLTLLNHLLVEARRGLAATARDQTSPPSGPSSRRSP